MNGPSISSFARSPILYNDVFVKLVCFRNYVLLLGEHVALHLPCDKLVPLIVLPGVMIYISSLNTS